MSSFSPLSSMSSLSRLSSLFSSPLVSSVSNHTHLLIVDLERPFFLCGAIAIDIDHDHRYRRSTRPPPFLSSLQPNLGWRGRASQEKTKQTQAQQLLMAASPPLFSLSISVNSPGLWPANAAVMSFHEHHIYTALPCLIARGSAAPPADALFCVTGAIGRAPTSVPDDREEADDERERMWQI